MLQGRRNDAAQVIRNIVSTRRTPSSWFRDLKLVCSRFNDLPKIQIMDVFIDFGFISDQSSRPSSSQKDRLIMNLEKRNLSILIDRLGA